MISRIVRWSLELRLLVLLITVGICVGGVFALSRLSVDAFPDISPNLVQVFAEVEGMAPEEVEQLVTRPVEIVMRSIPGANKIRSLSSLGLSTVNVYFDDDVDIYFARQQVTERLKHAEEAIPTSVNMPHGLEMGPVASGMGKILAYYLKADASHDISDLRTLQDWVIKRDIETIEGVAKVVSQGGYVRQYQIDIQPEQLLAYDLTIEDVIGAVENNNANVGAGVIRRGSEELVVRSLGRLNSAEDIEQVIIKADGARVIYVKDVATVTFGEAFRRGVAILDGKEEVVVGGVYKLHKANSFKVINKLKERIVEINETLPAGVTMVPFYDQSELVRNSIRTVRQALVLGLILVCVVAFLFLGEMRNTIIMVCSLPFSVLFAFILMERFGIAGDLISFGGVAVALGMIIDATIIMVEKIQTAINEKSGKMDAVDIIRSAAQEVGRPIVFAVFIIVIVFLPIFTLGHVEGKMFRPLAFTVATTMAGSLIYALIIAPVFYRLLHSLGGRGKGKVSRHRVLSKVQDIYAAVLGRLLGHPVILTVAIVVLLVVGGVFFVGLGREFVPTLQEGTIQCLAYMNPNIALDQIKETTEGISAEVLELPEVQHVVADIGYGEVGPHVHHTNYACITVTLADRDTWTSGETQEELVALINKRVEDYLGVNISFSQPINHEVDGLIAGVGAQVAAKIFGHDTDSLQKAASEIEHVLSGIAGVADLRVEQMSGQTQLQIDLNSEQLARYGLNRHEVQSLIHCAITGREVGHIFEGEKAFRIMVRFEDRYREDIETVSNMLVQTPDGGHVPLREIAEIQTVTGLRQITREDTQRYTSVQCNVRARDVGGFVAEAQKAVAEQVTLPAGYRIAWGGQFELQEAASRRLAIVVPITLFLIVIMLYGLFHSVSNVTLILLNIPLALVGGVFALKVTGANLSIPSSIGFIALFGIAITDGLVLVSRFEHLRGEGMPLREAVIAGSRSKLRPVLMTTLTTALGLAPLILTGGVGSEVQRPLAIVVVGGLSSSTLLTLIVLPTLYWHINRRRAQTEAESAAA